MSDTRDKAAGDFSRAYTTDQVGDALEFSFRASDAECRALATRFGLIAVRYFEGAGRLVREGDAGGYGMRAHWRAGIEQECSVSLEAFESDVSGDVQLMFWPEEMEREEADRDGEEDILLEPDEEPEEFYAGGRLDAGAVLADYLALSLDPFPRKPDAVLPEGSAVSSGDAGQDEQEESARNPFSVLEEFRKKLEDKG